MTIPIIILHGWGASSKSFSEVKKLLENERFSVEVPDLPGFGKAPLQRVMTFDDYVSFVKELIGKRRVVAVGHSFGGRILIPLAAQNPHLFEKLILVDASGITHPRSWKKNLGYIAAKAGKVVFSFPFVWRLSPLVRKILYVFLDEWDYYKSKGLLLETFKNVYRKDVQEHMQKIRIPTLIIWGEKDNTTPLSDGLLMKHRIPTAELIIIKGGTHEVAYKMPHIFVEKILPFLKQ